jgi:antitoxin (DNA-binding transcriptional repressor) of toxin-antitoxin stability system
LRSNAIGYLERVLAGETLEVARRGKLVARIVSASGDRPTPTTLPDLVVVNGAGARVGLGELRTRAGRCFDRVAAGETIWVVWRGKMVAKIASVAGDTGPPAALPDRVGTGARVPVQLDQLRSQAGRYFDRVAEGEPSRSSGAENWWAALCLRRPSRATWHDVVAVFDFPKADRHRAFFTFRRLGCPMTAVDGCPVQ